MREVDDKLLTTVYWSLGLVGTITAVLVGFSWFANLRIYERDKSALLQELSGTITRELAKLREEIQKESGKARVVATTTLSELQKTLESRVASVEEGQGKVAKDAADRARSALETAMNAAEAARLRQELRIQDLSIEVWRLKKSQNNVILEISRWLQLNARAPQSDMQVAVKLEELIAAFREGGTAGSYVVSDLIAALDRLSSVHATDVENIKSLIRAQRA